MARAPASPVATLGTLPAAPAPVVAAASTRPWEVRAAYDIVHDAWRSDADGDSEEGYDFWSKPRESWPWTYFVGQVLKEAASALEWEELEALATRLEADVVAEAKRRCGTPFVDSFAKAATAVAPSALGKRTAAEAALEELQPPKSHSRSTSRKVSIVDQSAAPRGPATEASKKASTVCKVTPRARMEEFPNQSFTPDPNNADFIFCNACTAPFGTTLQCIKQHLNTKKHKENLTKWERHKEKGNALVRALEMHRDTGMREARATGGSAGRGASVTNSERVFRLETLQAALRAGTPIWSLATWRPHKNTAICA